jgi:hypothetical protein
MCAFSLPYLDCIMRWINLFVVGGVISNKLYMRWINLFGFMLDGFESI